MGAHVPEETDDQPWTIQRRLLPHAARCSYIFANSLVVGDELADDCHNLGYLYADQGKLVEAERMYQRALQGYEKATGPDSISTYVPAVHTTFNLGLLFEHQAEIVTARIMFSKALRGYVQVFGLDHTESETARNKLCALDVRLENKVLVETINK